jgi:hypothetical protein
MTAYDIHRFLERRRLRRHGLRRRGDSVASRRQLFCTISLGLVWALNRPWFGYVSWMAIGWSVVYTQRACVHGASSKPVKLAQGALGAPGIPSGIVSPITRSGAPEV